MTTACSLSTHGCNLSGPMDLLTSNKFKCSLTWSSSTKSKPSLFQIFLPVSRAWDSRRLVLLVNTEAKKVLRTSVFSPSFVASSPTPFSSEGTAGVGRVREGGLVFLLLLIYLQHPFLLTFKSLLKSRSALVFLTLPLQDQTATLHSSFVT